MKQIFDIKTNPIYSAGEKELEPRLEIILVHTDGKKYEASGKGYKAVPILKESRFFMNPAELDGFITDMQTAKIQMETIKMNCSVINQVVTQLKK